MRSTGIVRGGALALMVTVGLGILSLGAWRGLGQVVVGPSVRFRVVQVIEQFVIDLEDAPQDEVPRYNTIALADFERDGVPDLAAIDNDQGLVVTYAGVGDGTFAGTVAVEAGDVLAPVAVVAEDFTGPFEVNGGAPDGNVDLFVIDEDGTIALLIGDGAGNFAQPEQVIEFVHDLADFLTGAVAADFDGDGDMDVAIADQDEVLFVCNDEGTMVRCPTGLVILPGRTIVVDLGAGDFDGDGAADVLTIAPTEGVAYPIWGDGDGNFTVDELGLPLYPEGAPDEARLAIANFDDSASEDFVVINNEDFSDINGATFLGMGARRFRSVGLSAPFEANGIAAGDFSDDGAPDLLFSNRLGLFFLAGNGTGDFSNSLGATPASEAGPIPGRRMGGAEVLKSADLDGDGLLDLVGLVSDGTEIEVALNVTGEPTPTPRMLPSHTPTPTGMPIDTRPTVATPTETPSLATPTGTRSPQPTATSPGLPTRTIPPADFDDASCAVVRPAPNSSASWPLLVAFLWITVGRRSARRPH